MNFEERLDRFPEGWRPKAGDKLIGNIVEISARESEYGGTYPLVIVSTEDGREVAIHGFHAVLKNELARLRPKTGDKLGVRYHGRDAAGWEKYRVLLERTEPEDAPAPDWAAMTEAGTAPQDWSEPAPEVAPDDAARL